MQRFEAKPHSALKKYIKSYWSEIDQSSERGHTTIYPYGGTHISFDVTGTHYKCHHESQRAIPHSRIVGATKTPYHFQRKGSWDSFHISFQPGFASCFLNIPGNEITDQDIDLMDVWGNQTHYLREQLACAPSFSTRVTLIETELLKRLEKVDPISPAVETSLKIIETSKNSISIDSLARKLGITTRHLRREFQKYVGLSPKFFERTQRLHSVLEDVKKDHFSNMTQLAEASGYYDQAHMIHEFKFFTGKSPLQLLQK